MSGRNSGRMWTTRAEKAEVMKHCNRRPSARAHLTALLLTLLGVAGGSVLPIASSRSLVPDRETGQSYAEPLGRPLSQATSAGRIVFNGHEGIFIMDADGTNVRQLSPSGFAPAFSLDGRKVAFTSGQTPFGCNNSDLNIIPSIFGTDQRPLTSVCGYDQDPAWSPDGARIAFWSDRNAGEGLYVMNADGSNQMLVLSTSSIQRQIESPHWSPDGTRITFVGYSLNANNEGDIFVVNADGSNPTNITNTPTADSEYSPAWSRDGAKIAFSKLNGNSGTGFTSGDIWVMNATGGNRVKLTNAANDVFNTKSTWSPDNTRIAFASNPGNGNAEIYVMNADGSGQMNLSNSPGNDSYPDWQVAAPAPTTNPIDDAQFFVRQHYIDFLNREPDAPGLAHWTGEITECNDPAKRQPGESLALCTERTRANTSAAFFFSPEFQNTGSFALRAYWGTLGKLLSAPCPGVPFGLLGNCRPQYSQYIADAGQIAQGIVVNDKLAPDVINANKHAFVEQFVNRPEFRARYDGLTNAQFVDRLFETTGVIPTSAEREALIAELANGNGSNAAKASVVFKVVDGTQTITDGALVFQTRYGEAFYNQEFDTTFVFMEYIGYLRRNPDQDGYDFWLAKLKQYGNWLDAQMVLAFIVSPEYRSRFGQP